MKIPSSINCSGMSDVKCRDISSDLTIGVIGGMGPYATAAFFNSLVLNVSAEKDWDHPRIVIDNNPKIPSRTRAFLYGEQDPVPAMIASARVLEGAGADFLVMPCNSAHYFLPRVMSEVRTPFINMISVTCAEILNNKISRVGVLAGEVTVLGKLYEQALCSHGIQVLQVDEVAQRDVRSIIEDGKRNSITKKTHQTLQRLIDSLVNRGADCIVLGCTELPLVVGGVKANCPLIDSMGILAQVAIATAKGRRPLPVTT